MIFPQLGSTLTQSYNTLVMNEIGKFLTLSIILGKNGKFGFLKRKRVQYEISI
jgi:hypothetical protein